MTKQEFLDSLKDFSPDFPKEALMEIQSNRADFIPELLDSLDYAHRNAKELCESKGNKNVKSQRHNYT